MPYDKPMHRFKCTLTKRAPTKLSTIHDWVLSQNNHVKPCGWSKEHIRHQIEQAECTVANEADVTALTNEELVAFHANMKDRADEYKGNSRRGSPYRSAMFRSYAEFLKRSGPNG